MKICLFTNARDEKHIKEWIAHHLNLGFDHVYIFDHKSKIPIRSQVKPNNSITIERVNFTNEAFKDLLMMKARNISLNKYDWFLYLDADEFFIMKDSINVHDFMEQYSEYNQVGFNWLVFGTSYLTHEPEGMLMENYLRCSSLLNMRIKCFVRPSSIITTISPHVFKTTNMKLTINGITMKPLHKEITSHYPINCDHQKANAYIAHFMYQSYDVYLSRKVNLPRDDTNAFRKKLLENELHEIANDVINIDLRDKYVEVNKALIAEL
jgi:hypothetical protein